MREHTAINLTSEIHEGKSVDIAQKPHRLLIMTVSAQPLDVLVVGAGIAGLSAAIALGKQGHRVVVCPEQ